MGWDDPTGQGGTVAENQHDEEMTKLEEEMRNFVPKPPTRAAIIYDVALDFQMDAMGGIITYREAATRVRKLFKQVKDAAPEDRAKLHKDLTTLLKNVEHDASRE
jgi:hypothetical protein